MAGSEVQRNVKSGRLSVSSDDCAPVMSDSDEEKPVRPALLVPRELERQDSASSADHEGERKEELSPELVEKIVQQAEFYFSDENLKRDGFLLKHVKRNKEGYVNLKLLASFKKMKSLTKNFEAVQEALKNSNYLELNATGLKVRRKTPLPKDLLEMVRVKSIVVSKISHENPSMDYIADAFAEQKHDVVSVRIIKPGKKFPHDLQSHFARHPELAEEVVAVVEFETPDAVALALKANFEESLEYKNLQVKLLELGPKQSNKKKKELEGSVETGSDTPVSDQAPSKSRKPKKKVDRVADLTALHDEGSSSYVSSSDGEGSSFASFKSCARRFNRSNPSSGTNSPHTSPQVQRRPQSLDVNNNSGNSTPSNSPHINGQKSPVSSGHKVSPLVTSSSPYSSPENRRRGVKVTGDEATSSQSAWFMRRMQAAKSDKESGLHQVGKHLEVIRQPRGPDGSSGFANHPMKKYIVIHAC